MHTRAGDVPPSPLRHVPPSFVFTFCRCTGVKNPILCSYIPGHELNANSLKPASNRKSNGEFPGLNIPLRIVIGGTERQMTVPTRLILHHLDMEFPHKRLVIPSHRPGFLPVAGRGMVRDSTKQPENSLEISWGELRPEDCKV